MKVIVWLGNPWLQYEKTRHNTGFLFVDHFAQVNHFSSFADSKFDGVIAEGVVNGEKTILLKPTTFMNISGQSVQKLANFYHLDMAKDVCVVFDDVSMDFGKVRVRSEWSAGGHNGIKSIIAKCGTQSFFRVKIGIGNNPQWELSDWVLGKFSKTEIEELDEIFIRAGEEVEKWIEG